MKKFAACGFLLLLLLSAGCAFSLSLPEGFDKSEVESRAQEVVGIINGQDYDAVVALLRSDLQGQVTAAQLKEAWEGKLSELGSFLEVTNISLLGQKDQNTKEDYATAVLVCKYENGTATFTLSFDSDLALVGLYMK